MATTTLDTKMLEEIVGHLGAAQIQRLPSDDRLIAGHIDVAHSLASLLWKQSLQDQKVS